MALPQIHVSTPPPPPPPPPAAAEGDLGLKNALANSSSPYLRAHKDNPVAWQEWNAQSIALAKQHQRLIFLSIGYHACHWCHVMERESFTSPDVARLLNHAFISIKLDRESRPDLDDIYMNYVTATTGSGGWPLNVFLTPDLQPVFGGTYWPGPSSSRAPPSDATDDKPLTFLDILGKMDTIWRVERERCIQAAADITRQLRAFSAEGIHAHSSVHVKGVEEDDAPEPLELDLIDDALDHFISRYDAQHGGFNQSSQPGPKFPTPVNLTFLLRIGASITRPSTHTRFGFPHPVPGILGRKSCTNAASMALHTLLVMSRSGLRDHLGHGFHRYSVTPDWNLPHFEKMLDDNAQLLGAYCDAWALGRDPEILGTINDLVEYLTDPSSPIVRPHGGWYASENADSSPAPAAASTDMHGAETKEGAYYIWTLKEVQSVIGNDTEAAVMARHLGIAEHGNVLPQHDVNDELINQNVLHIDATPSVLAKEFGLGEDEIVGMIKNGKARLARHRDEHRVRPDVGTKVILSWNALVISALTRAANTLLTFDEARTQRCLDAAAKAVAFIKTEMYDATTGRLTRIHRAVDARGTSPHDEADGLAFLDDYTYLIFALIKIYDITLDHSYLDFAYALQDTLDRDFFAGKHGAYFQSPRSDVAPGSNGASDVSGTATAAAMGGNYVADRILNLKPGTDSSLPSPNGITAINLLYLASYASSETTADAAHKSSHLVSRARDTINTFAPEVIQHPFLYVSLLSAVILNDVGVKSIVVPTSMSSGEIEEKSLRGFGRTVVRRAGLQPGEVMLCSREGLCRPLKAGDLDGGDDDELDDAHEKKPQPPPPPPQQ